MRKIKVLIAEDHRILRAGIKSLLEKEGDIEIAGEAKSGCEAIKKVNELEPDIVLMDVAMPLMDGVKATRKIKELHPELVIIILTQHDDDEYLFSLLKAGVSGYLLKKSAGSELASTIRAANKGKMLFSSSIAKRVVDSYLNNSNGRSSKVNANLTKREVEILELIGHGFCNKEIAQKLYLSIKTVETHRTNIFRKLEINDRSQAVSYAYRNGLIKTS